MRVFRALLCGLHSPHASRLSERQQQERDHAKQHGDTHLRMESRWGVNCKGQSIDQEQLSFPLFPNTYSGCTGILSQPPPDSCFPHERCWKQTCRGSRGALGGYVSGVPRRRPHDAVFVVSSSNHIISCLPQITETFNGAFKLKKYSKVAVKLLENYIKFRLTERSA